MENPFTDIDTDGKVPEYLKKALVAEIDTLRTTMELVTLYVGNFLTTVGKMTTIETQENTDDKISS
ncbi:MAG: hypothetical protein ACK4GN_04430 [Runella sp.]